jgi:hypothetical protein
MHALPGGQNPDWHSDSGSNYAAFWDHKDYQDRAIVTNLFLCQIPWAPYFNGRENETYSRLIPGSLSSKETCC